MRTEKLNYHLPPDLIAQRPLRSRSSSRLLVLDRSPTAFPLGGSGGRLTDSRFSSIGEFLSRGDCLVLNDTKVIPARFFAQRATGAKIEGLFLAEIKTGVWRVLLKPARRVKPGEKLYIKSRDKNVFCTTEVIEKKTDSGWLLKVQTDSDAETILNKIGFPPLPPYIKRDDSLRAAETDKRRYQTVYARKAGAVAAPTAGLHFTNQLINQLKQAGIHFAYITLHVGMGTFKPITSETLEDHRMHQERFEIDRETAGIINRVKADGGRIIAVGTTSVRLLETVATNSKVEAAGGTTGLFIRPGYKFKIVDAMITNFHLPKSTLLALVAAFAGLDKTIAAYKHAIEQRYRFYSYGDAMLII
jgi:S-adenosylmethionine:tRNA ribosyltransferase-isomerase